MWKTLPDLVQNVIFDFSKFGFTNKFPFLKNTKTVDEISNVEPDSGNYLTRIGSFYGVCGASTRLLRDWIKDLRSTFKNVNNVIGVVDNEAEISYKMIMVFLSQDSSLDFTLLEQNRTDILRQNRILQSSTGCTPPPVEIGPGPGPGPNKTKFLHPNIPPDFGKHPDIPTDFAT